VRRDGEDWRVSIVDPGGREVSMRACRDEIEARTYASTVRQHVAWLSEAKFRAYYSIGGSGTLEERADQASDGSRVDEEA
jgi:hypothetical protein